MPDYPYRSKTRHSCVRPGTQNHQKSGDNEIGFADNCVANIGITGKEISIETKVKTIRPLKIKLKIIF